MNFQQKLGSLKVAIDRELETFFDTSIAEARKNDILIAEALSHTKKIALAGGKRIRGALLFSSYVGLGGKEKKKILKVAAAIELVHLFLLMHDDIIDRGQLRHGQKTLHVLLAQKKSKALGNAEALHFGNSIAIIAGEMLHALANKMIIEAGLEKGATLEALAVLQEIVSRTIIGQSQDIAIEYAKNVSEREVLNMYENKTARYTFEGPLYLGAKLAACNDKKTFQMFTRFAIPVGIAFQIQDDMLGIFGDEKKMGKSAASDIAEGKQSLMVVKARQLADPAQKKQLSEILGKKDLSKKEIGIFQDIIKKTGALEYAQHMSEEFLKTGKREIAKAILLPESKKFLLGLVEYLEKREI